MQLLQFYTRDRSLFLRGQLRPEKNHLRRIMFIRKISAHINVSMGSLRQGKIIITSKHS